MLPLRAASLVVSGAAAAGLSASSCCSAGRTSAGSPSSAYDTRRQGVLKTSDVGPRDPTPLSELRLPRARAVLSDAASHGTHRFRALWLWAGENGFTVDG